MFRTAISRVSIHPFMCRAATGFDLRLVVNSARRVVTLPSVLITRSAPTPSRHSGGRSWKDMKVNITQWISTCVHWQARMSNLFLRFSRQVQPLETARSGGIPSFIACLEQKLLLFHLRPQRLMYLLPQLLYLRLARSQVRCTPGNRSHLVYIETTRYWSPPQLRIQTAH